MIRFVHRQHRSQMPTGIIRSVLAQTKRLALLVTLAASRSGRSRRILLGLFWPDQDTEHARGAAPEPYAFCGANSAGRSLSVSAIPGGDSAR
jgi:hypothetical protein